MTDINVPVWWMVDPESNAIVSPFVRQPAYSITLERNRALEAFVQRVADSDMTEAAYAIEARKLLRPAEATHSDACKFRNMARPSSCDSECSPAAKETNHG